MVLDLAVQAVRVTYLSLIFAARPDARSRIGAGCMVFYSIGSSVVAIASTAAYAQAGWIGVVILGGAFSTAGLIVGAATGRSDNHAHSGRTRFPRAHA